MCLETLKLDEQTQINKQMRRKPAQNPGLRSWCRLLQRAPMTAPSHLPQGSVAPSGPALSFSLLLESRRTPSIHADQWHFSFHRFYRVLWGICFFLPPFLNCKRTQSFKPRDGKLFLTGRYLQLCGPCCLFCNCSTLWWTRSEIIHK